MYEKEFEVSWCFAIDLIKFSDAYKKISPDCGLNGLYGLIRSIGRAFEYSDINIIECKVIQEIVYNFIKYRKWEYEIEDKNIFWYIVSYLLKHNREYYSDNHLLIAESIAATLKECQYRRDEYICSKIYHSACLLASGRFREIDVPEDARLDKSILYIQGMCR